MNTKNNALIILKSLMKYVWTVCLLLSLSVGLRGQHVTVSGHVYEKGSLETLPGGLVYEPQSQLSTSTNTYGFYTLTLPYRDSMFVVYNCFGYVNDTLWITSPGNCEYDARLSKIQLLETVTITAEKTNTEKVQMSAVTLSAKEIQSVPMLFGEKDVFKTLLLMPGVQSASEGTSGIYVRGGAASLGTPTASLSAITAGTMSLFSRIADRSLTARRVTVAVSPPSLTSTCATATRRATMWRVG